MLHICGRAARSILLPLNERDVSLKLTCSNFSSQVCYYSPPKIVLAKTARYRNNFGNESRAISTGCTKSDVGSTSCRNASGMRLFLSELDRFDVLSVLRLWFSAFLYTFPFFGISIIYLFLTRTISNINIFFNFYTFDSLSSCFIATLFSTQFIFNIILLFL